MNNTMGKKIVLILMMALSSLAHAQKGKAMLILKDSTRINGTGEISGISSIVTVKFYNDTLKLKTYKFEEIIGIDILENNYFRKFRYKLTDKYGKKKRYPELLEIVSLDNLSLYVRIYETSVLSNSFSNEPIQIGGSSDPLNDNYVSEVELDNGDKIKIAKSFNKYQEITFPRYSYYVGKGKSDEVDHLYTKGLPFAKNFKNAMKDYFQDCPELIEKVKNKEFNNNELWKVLEFYNRKCLNVNLE
ncbi:hypothetical protein [Snuella lapsa]|uniref:Uncharacterized protein n=1 Tax=Snuella lapsa TaxID=870481 RepID=A0ABP6XPC4_9FLAO